MGFLAQSRAERPRRGSNDFTNATALAEEQIPFFVSRVAWHEGGGMQGQDIWRLDIFAYEGDELPNGQSEAQFSLTSNPAGRDADMEAMQDALEDVKLAPEGYIGPFCVVKIKAGRNGRWNEICDWDEERNQPVLPNGREPAPVQEEPATRPGRRPARAPSAPSRAAAPARPPVAEAASSPARPPEAAPAAPQEQAEEGEQRRPFGGPSGAPEELPPYEATPSEVTVRRWARANGYEVKDRGRIAQKVYNAYHAAQGGWEGGQRAAPQDVSRRHFETRPAQVPQRSSTEGGGRPGSIPQQGGANRSAGVHAQEAVFQPGMLGQALEPCESCGLRERGRAFPAMDGQGHAVMHVCPSTNQPRPVRAELLESEGEEE